MYEPKQKEVYTFNGTGRSATVIDAAGTWSRPSRSAEAGSGRPDRPPTRVCEQRDRSTIVVIDVAKHEVVANWPIAPGESAAGWRST